jgi:hypothetical protein
MRAATEKIAAEVDQNNSCGSLRASAKELHAVKWGAREGNWAW